MATDVAGETLEAVRKHLASYGIEFAHEGLEFSVDPGMWKGTLRYGDSTALVRVVLAEPMTLSTLGRLGLADDQLSSPNLRALVIGRHVHERSASGFRSIGLDYADAVGNAHLRFGGVLIDVRGRRASDSDDRHLTSPDTRARNLFSTGRSQVVVALITWPELSQRPVREVARAAGVSTGQAHGALTLLAENGYLIDRRLRLDRADELIDLWAAAYPRGLGQKLAVASYVGPDKIGDEGRQMLRGTPSVAEREGFSLSGEAVPGLGVKEPLSLTLYTRDWTPREAISHRWRAARTAAEANIHIRRRFWAPPPNLVVSSEGGPIAPWPLVYADLLATDDHRLSAVAADWRSRHRSG